MQVLGQWYILATYSERDRQQQEQASAGRGSAELFIHKTADRLYQTFYTASA